MDIAVLFGEVGFISHRKMIDGMLDEAYKNNMNIFLFTCDGWKYMENKAYGDGEFNIYELPDLDRFAGVIVDLDSIHDKYARELILEKIRKTKTSAVSMNIPFGIENTKCIQLENVTGITNMVDHLVNVHGAKNIHFISGPTHNRDALKRRDVFCSSILAHGLFCGPEDISYGDFQYHSGQKVIAKFIEEGRNLPDAFIAANDQMALGAMLELNKRGYRVPEDVIVMGYDNSEIAQTISPRLSTVKRDEMEAGRLAVQVINKMNKGESVDDSLVIYGENIYAESCGCSKEKSTQRINTIMELAAEKIYTDNNLEALKSTTIAFSNMHSFSHFSMRLQRYVEQMEHDFFYLCLCGNKEQYYSEIELLSEGKDLDRDSTEYLEEITVPLAYEDGEWRSYPTFSKSDILPPDCQMRRYGAFYIVMPVHYGDYCIGYCVIGNYKKKVAERFIQHLVLSINNALGNIREYDLKETMLARINQRWLYDDLTGIYNRTGLWQKVTEYINRVHEEGRKIAVYFIDLDGLKKINDKFGHEKGDKYIQSMAEILKNHNDDGLYARYGGDEYIIVTSYKNKAEVAMGAERIEKLIDDYNSKDCDHKLSASIGYQLEESFENFDIRQMIEYADEAMYIEKRERHRREEETEHNESE